MLPLPAAPFVDWLKRHQPWLFAAAWLGVILLLKLAMPTTVTGMAMRAPVSTVVDLPYTFEHGSGPYTFVGRLHATSRTRFISVRMDDCIQSISIGGRVIHTTPCQRNESWYMQRIALPADLAEGEHELIIKGKNNGGEGLLDIRQARGLTWLDVVALWGLCLAWLAVTRFKRLPAYAAWVGATALIVGFSYHFNNDAFMRSHDVGGHREYVTLLLKSWTLPQVKQGWETWQPPLYYVTAAALIRTLTQLSDHDPFRMLQWLSLGVYLSVVLVALVRWPSFHFPAESAWVGPTMLALLPAHVFVSGRVSNDVLMGLWGMLATLLGWSYVQVARRRTLVILGVVLVLSLMNKSSSLSLCVGAGLVVLWKDHVLGRTPLERLINLGIIAIPSLVWFGGWLLRNHDQTGEWLYVNAELGPQLSVPNVAWKYLSFDYDAFLSEKEFSTFGGKLRESLPAALAATSLNGEFIWAGMSHAFITFLRAAYIPMLLMLALGFFNAPPSMMARPWLPAVLIGGTHAFFMVSYNWKYPYACNEDARLWSPALVPAAILWSWGHEVLRSRLPARLRWVSWAIPVVMVALLVAYLKEVILL